MADDNLNDRLVAAFHESGISRNELARRTGMDPTSLGRWVAGERGLGLERAERIAAALGLRIDLVVARENNRRNSP